MDQDFLTSEHELGIDREASGYLIETAKWAKFIALTFCILTAIFFVVFIVFDKQVMDMVGMFGSLNDSDSIFMVLVVGFVVAVVIIAFTYYFLLNFANKMIAGIETENIDLVNGGLKSLKTHFIIIGVLLILGLLGTLFGFLA